jgi:hypothetical protein
MPSINISDLRPVGSELFEDSENFIYELTDNELVFVQGQGRFDSIVNVNVNASNIVAVSAITANGNTINANTIGNANTLP